MRTSGFPSPLVSCAREHAMLRAVRMAFLNARKWQARLGMLEDNFEAKLAGHGNVAVSSVGTVKYSLILS